MQINTRYFLSQNSQNFRKKGTNSKLSFTSVLHQDNYCGPIKKINEDLTNGPGPIFPWVLPELKKSGIKTIVFFDEGQLSWSRKNRLDKSFKLIDCTIPDYDEYGDQRFLNVNDIKKASEKFSNIMDDPNTQKPVYACCIYNLDRTPAVTKKWIQNSLLKDQNKNMKFRN